MNWIKFFTIFIFAIALISIGIMWFVDSDPQARMVVTYQQEGYIIHERGTFNKLQDCLDTQEAFYRIKSISEDPWFLIRTFKCEKL